MRILGWVVCWVALVGLAGWYLWQRLRGLRGRIGALSDQLDETASLGYAVRLAAEERLQTLAEQEAATEAAGSTRHALAVFEDPARLARERDRLRESLAGERRARRAAALPGWARPVDSQSTPSDRKAVSP